MYCLYFHLFTSYCVSTLPLEYIFSCSRYTLHINAELKAKTLFLSKKDSSGKMRATSQIYVWQGASWGIC